MKDNLDIDFVSLESLVDNPIELNKQMRLDLIRLVDSIRQQMMENGSVGVQQQNQLVQSLKMIKVLNQEIDKASLGNGGAMEALFQNLPFASDSEDRAEPITDKLPFDDGIN
tara:strand:+ start:1974 stop:2309 length:336 start_codon:yes stop_codon:yes gene_type:complete